ncbi:UvrD-helicase domain-containing protein [Novosphingobium sp. KACC 22771]|uniref:UvrD-helicase domain-containing protein n=1 Tax=Novosphingobium sp. KACC 22771 TaxID=3025670 RepID=UPI00236526BA|nr:ATP-dependent helicase [Novosphingobium sp. KACC 22771]WDF73048.1 ATP-dependent helicase [Novosphingobium sp. KACC 22771]
MALIRPADWRPQGVADLEPRAWEALHETTLNVCVTAGAGAGKTEFLAQKATYLLQTGICPRPRRILAISFKRDAARNLAERVAARCPPEQARRFSSMTFDAFTKHLLDQFRDAIPEAYRPPSDYEITFVTDDQVRAFLRRAGAPNVAADALTKAIARVPLPLEDADIKPRTREILQGFWHEMYERYHACLLTFPMINRLVELMLRTNPKILQALRSTYAFVFLDEFQDTTYPQFDLVKTAFGAGSTALTAVGDDKQKIMGWAGAMKNAFAEFNALTHARSIDLLCNWRSHADLVEIQHQIARRIDPEVELPEAKQDRLVDGDIAAIWEFKNRDEEITALAGWIAREIGSGRVAPHNIAVLARKRVDRVESELEPALAAVGVTLRNLARNVGAIALQDLLAEDLTTLLIAFLRLGVSRRNAAAWTCAHDEMGRVLAVMEDDPAGQRQLADQLSTIARHVRKTLQTLSLDAGEVRGLVLSLIEAIGENALRSATPAYYRDADFARVVDGFVVLLEESIDASHSWSEALDRFEGLNQVALMTIHKSKGLEFHTMIFFGLDSRSWGSLQPDADEELNAFFVAFTRAAQRAFFTCCEARGGRIDWLEELLGDRVPRVSLQSA